MTVNIIATLQALPGKEDQLLDVLRQVMAPTLAEAGNLRYELYRSIANPAVFTFVEKFADAAAFDVHHNAPHSVALRAAVAGLLAHAPSIEQQTEVAAPV